ncbi:MAG TPA: MBL fold metallo-hydrolase [Thermoanaerobaculia bacterium]|nr:MBL fold metallo-hydrolase [Thermoanaerobaculia bacterium]
MRASRRVLRGFLLALVAGSARGEGLPHKAYEVVGLADGVWAFLWKDPSADLIESNALFVVNDRDVLVVDTGMVPSTARVMAAELKKLTDRPVRYVVNTHWHDDHHGGNDVYRELWPGVEFVAHRDTRADVLSQTYGSRPKDLARLDAQAEKYERWAKTGVDDEGKTLEPPRRQRADEIAALSRALAPELRAIREAPPDLTFDDRLVLHRGDRTIEVLWLGRGNTRGDVVVFLPRERIAATGDLFVQPIPFGIGSYYEDWAATLGRLDALEADVLVPGHGKVQCDRTYLRQVQALLTALVAEVKAAVSAGATLEETRERVTLDGWKARFAGTDPGLQRAFDAFFVQPAVERAWHQARGDADAPVDRGA